MIKVPSMHRLVFLLIPLWISLVAATEGTKLNDAEALWNSLKPTEYEYTFSWVCPFCSESATSRKRVVVKNSRVTNVRSLTGEELPINMSEVFTIAELYKVIRKAIPAGVRVTYDARYGYPTLIIFYPDVAGLGNQFQMVSSDLTVANLEAPADLVAAQTELDAARGVWNGQMLSSYQFVLTSDASSKMVVVTGDTITPADAYSISQLFDAIQEAISEGAYKLDVSYNGPYGYPESIEIVYNGLLPDEGVSYSVAQFEEIDTGATEAGNLTSSVTDIGTSTGITPTSVTQVVDLSVQVVSRNQAQLQAELDSAMTQWEVLGLVQYVYKHQVSCICDPSLTILMLVVVENGEISDVIDVSTGLSVSDEVKSSVRTIEDVFMDIQDAIVSNATVLDNVEYNAEMGYPELVMFDYTQQDTEDFVITIHDVVDLGDGLGNDYEQYIIARSQWDAQSITSYDYGYNITCAECDSGTHAVSVKNGLVRSSINLSTGQFTSTGMTVDEIFGKILDAIYMQASVVDVNYNPTYGFPDSLLIDYDEKNTDKLSIAISSFTSTTVIVMAQVRQTLTPSAALNQARTLWSGKNIDDYSYDYHNNCASCSAPVRVYVRSGNVFGTSPVDTLSSSTLYMQNAATVHTVNQLFQEIEGAINAGATVDVDYNPMYGFPERAAIVYGGEMMGEDITVEINGFYNLESSKTFQQSVEQARSLWEYRGISNYAYEFQRVCFCGAENIMPMNVTVSNGALSSVTIGETQVSAAIQENVKTVDQMFLMMQMIISGTNMMTDVVTDMKVQFNTEFGYPKRIYIERNNDAYNFEIMTVKNLAKM